LIKLNKDPYNMQVRVKENPEEFGSCGCGRSPNGKCCGWHGLSEEQYQIVLEEYEKSLFEDGDEI
jgi:hypothetical protein